MKIQRFRDQVNRLSQFVESLASDFKPGDFVIGLFGWQDYAVGAGPQPTSVSRVVPVHPLKTYLSVLGGTGLTAYFGLMDVGQAKPGETVVVSAAAGATGSTAAQIAKIQGCRAIGIAGGPVKCRWLTEELALDAAIDYKKERVDARLAELCPKGIDVYFDNVGGSLLEIGDPEPGPPGSRRALRNDLYVQRRTAPAGSVESFPPDRSAGADGRFSGRGLCGAI
jgi:NADPH-dependent curcumin reductase CurA